jgi:hypothetical protein
MVLKFPNCSNEHWHRFPECVRFKIAVLTFRALHCTAYDRYICHMICVASLTFSLVVAYGHRQLTGLTFDLLVSG